MEGDRPWEMVPGATGNLRSPTVYVLDPSKILSRGPGRAGEVSARLPPWRKNRLRQGWDAGVFVHWKWAVGLEGGLYAAPCWQGDQGPLVRQAGRIK